MILQVQTLSSALLQDVLGANLQFLRKFEYSFSQFYNSRTAIIPYDASTYPPN